MTDQDVQIQCVTCGKNGFPPGECQTCHGKADVEPRKYTLSEVRSGRAPEDDRYGTGGSVSPKIANLPGSAGQGGSF
jgi:hypothetical protein